MMESYEENQATPEPDPEPAVPASLEGEYCVSHPEVRAIAQCHVCKTGMCETCKFSYPGDFYLCPECAVNMVKTMSDRRMRNLVFAFIAAIASTVLLVTVFIMSMFSEAQWVELGFTGALFLALIGTGLSLVLKDPRLYSPTSITVSLIWNGGIFAIIMVLSIIGTLML